jgi:putative FmdB family regulatory protein
VLRGRDYHRAMPIYEFKCVECGELFERLLDAGTDTCACPACGAAGAPRRFSSFGVASRQLTPRQRRRLEDKRGIDRGGARTRFKRDLARRRERKPPGAGA